MPEVYGFTAEQMGRVVAAVETVEGQRPTQTAAAPGPRPQAAPLHHVKVTSTTLSSGFYPGTIQLYDASTQTWSDGAAVNFLSSNGDAPTLNRRYLARAVGIYASDGKPIYARDVSAAGGGSLAVNTTNAGTGDTTVSNPAVTTIQVDQASGLKEVTVSGGTITISAQDATTTHRGVVNTTTQTFAGTKSFNNGIVVDQGATVANSYNLTVASSSGNRAVVINAGNVAEAIDNVASDAALSFHIDGNDVSGAQVTRIRMWSRDTVHGNNTQFVDFLGQTSIGSGVPTLRIGAIGAALATGQSNTISFMKPGGSTGTITFTGGLKTGDT